jgi:hypothetical protein
MDTINRSRAGIFGTGMDAPDILGGDDLLSNPTQPVPPLDPTALAKSPNFLAHNPPGSMSPAPEYPTIPPRQQKTRSALDPTGGMDRKMAPIREIGSEYSQSLGLPDSGGGGSAGGGMASLLPQIANAAAQIPQALGMVGDPYPGTNLSSSSSTGMPTGDMAYLTPFFSTRANSITEGPVGQVNAAKTVD